MNLICNNCGGADFYNLLKLPYNNPFIWCATFANDILKLIQNYENINFNNFKLVKLTEEIAKESNYIEYDKNKHILGINVDNVFTIYYTHYVYSNKYNVPVKIGPDILYNRNFEYTYFKYNARKEKLLQNNEKPVFLILAFDRHGWTIEKIKQLLEIQSKYKICLITDENIITNKNTIKIIYDHDLEKLKFPLDIIKKHFNEIKNFLL